VANQGVRPDSSERTVERLRAHWTIERELAQRLRAAGREERTQLYGTIYDELFRRVPDHPQVIRKRNPTERLAEIRYQESLIKHFLAPGGTLLEVGAGDCAVSLALSSYAARVSAVEVSDEIAPHGETPANFELLITDGREIPVAPGTVDVVYSNQLMEHLHPDDAREQLENIFAALRGGGRYICLTPNRLLGPSDISQYFEPETASGLHLREYSETELRDLLRTVGFDSVHTLVTWRGSFWSAPIAPVLLIEALFSALPRSARLRLKRWRLLRRMMHPGGGVVASKA
jgi:SAM-dependent methyltransferase